MKKKYIAAMVVIAIAIVIIITSVGDASSYLTFNEAKELSIKGFSKNIHVVGQLTRSESGNVTGIQESPDKLSFKFKMIDEAGVQEEVFHANPVPTDFSKSEQVVIVGSYRGENFIADEILLKCPSKYEEEPDFKTTSTY